MALQWIIGDFKTGNITESSVLPVIKNADKISIDINAGDSATLTVSRADLPSDWRTYLKPAEKFVALVDTESTWATGVVWAGWINKISADVGSTVSIQAVGLREYLAARIVTDVYNTTNQNPTAGITFSQYNWNNVITAVVNHCFSSVGIPVNAPKPPAVFTPSTPSNGSTTLTILNSELAKYSEVIDDIKNNKSPTPIEYSFLARWSSSAKTKITWFLIVGNPTGISTTLSISLADNTWRPISFGQSQSSENMVSRIIGHSAAGEGTKGSDFTSKTAASSTAILLDSAFNPGVELTTAQMTSQLTSRLAAEASLNKTAEFSRTYETVTDLKVILSQLGNMASITGTGKAAQFGALMRIVELSFSPGEREVTVTLAPKADRYPKLPSDKDNSWGNSPSDNFDSGYGGYGPGSSGSGPIRPSLPSNIPSDLPPAFTLPGDSYQEKPAFSFGKMRRFTQSYPTGMYPTQQSNNNWHKVPALDRSRFNHRTGELIGLRNKSMRMYGGINNQWGSSPDAFDGGDWPRHRSIYLYSVDLPGMFNTETELADSARRQIGVIPYDLYSHAVFPRDVIPSLLPPTAGGTVSAVISEADFSLFCSEDFKTVFVQILITAYRNQTTEVDQTQHHEGYARIVVLKGQRNEAGLITEWEDISPQFTIVDEESKIYYFFSTDIYQINGVYKAFGAFYPLQKMRFRVEDLPYDPNMLRYRSFFIDMDFSDIPGSIAKRYRPDSINVQWTKPALYEDMAALYHYPLAVTVDYSYQNLTVGIVNGANDKTEFFNADLELANLSFTKILATQRAAKAGVIVKSTIYTAELPNSEDPAQHATQTPVVFGDNVIYFSGLGYASPSQSYLDKFKYVSPSLELVRGKIGSTDSITSKVGIPGNYVISKATQSLGNRLTGYTNSMYMGSVAIFPATVEGSSLTLVYRGKLYFLADSVFCNIENSPNDHWAEYRYWGAELNLEF